MLENTHILYTYQMRWIGGGWAIWKAMWCEWRASKVFDFFFSKYIPFPLHATTPAPESFRIGAKPRVLVCWTRLPCDPNREALLSRTKWVHTFCKWFDYGMFWLLGGIVLLHSMAAAAAVETAVATVRYCKKVSPEQRIAITTKVHWMTTSCENRCDVLCYWQ